MPPSSVETVVATAASVLISLAAAMLPPILFVFFFSFLLLHSGQPAAAASCYCHNLKKKLIGDRILCSRKLFEQMDQPDFFFKSERSIRHA